MSSRILVTGGTGFVGRNLLEHPDLKSYDVVAPTRQTLNLLDAGAVEDFFGRAKPDVVIHLAAHVGGIQANLADPVRFLEDNLKTGLNVITAARKARVPRLLNLGSSCMYPLTAPQPFEERGCVLGPFEPTNEGYAISKHATMRLCQYISRNGDFAYKTLIPPGIYGKYAHFEGDKAHLVCAVMARLHRAKIDGAPIAPIWGDGKAKREFLYAGDLVDCLAMVLDRWDTVPDVMNVGTGVQLSVTEWTLAIAEVVGFEGAFTHDLLKPSGASGKVMDVSLATRWGWTAKTPLRRGLEETYAAYQAQG